VVWLEDFKGSGFGIKNLTAGLRFKFQTKNRRFGWNFGLTRFGIEGDFFGGWGLPKEGLFIQHPIKFSKKAN